MYEKGFRSLRRLPIWGAPIVLIIAFLIQPYVGDWNDEEEVTREVAAASTRELAANLLGILYCAVAILAVFAVVSYLRRPAGERWSLPAAACLTFGFVLLAAHFALFMARALVIRNGVSTATGFGDELYTDMTGLVGGLLHGGIHSARACRPARHHAQRDAGVDSGGGHGSRLCWCRA